MTALLPATCVEALGGMEEGDPALLTAWWGEAPSLYDVDWIHPSTRPPADLENRVVLVEQSAPALLRMLARHFGAAPGAGSTPGWFTGARPEWFLYERDKNTLVVFAQTDDNTRSHKVRSVVVPGLTRGMSPPTALATVIRHVATNPAV